MATSIEGPIKLNILTPSKQSLDQASVDEVVIPGLLGAMTILPGHREILSTLQPGLVTFTRTGETQPVKAVLKSGFFECVENEATLLAQSYENFEDIDVSKSQSELGELKKTLENNLPSEESKRNQLEAEIKFIEAKIEAKSAPGKH